MSRKCFTKPKICVAPNIYYIFISYLFAALLMSAYTDMLHSVTLPLCTHKSLFVVFVYYCSYLLAAKCRHIYVLRRQRCRMSDTQFPHFFFHLCYIVNFRYFSLAFYIVYTFGKRVRRKMLCTKSMINRIIRTAKKGL